MNRFNITRGTVGDDGGCICCDAHAADANGNTPRAEPVNLIRASGSEIRACDSCLPKIGAALSGTPAPSPALVEAVALAEAMSQRFADGLTAPEQTEAHAAMMRALDAYRTARGGKAPMAPALVEAVKEEPVEAPNFYAPCPHPARRGEHETYTDGERMFCRACGAREIKKDDEVMVDGEKRGIVSKVLRDNRFKVLLDEFGRKSGWHVEATRVRIARRIGGGR